MTPPRRTPAPGGGFTIVEMAIVLAIVAVVTALAVPSFVRYVRRAKTAEVHESLEKIALGAKTYFQVDRSNSDGVRIARQFPDAIAATPATPCCDQAGSRCAATDWSAWKYIGFAIDANIHYYQYEFQSAGADSDATFTARAIGDIDCDGVRATWERRAAISGDYEITVGNMIVDSAADLE